MLAVLQVTIALLKKAMLASGSSSFLIDGFPRALDQAQTFEQQIQPCDMVSDTHTLHRCTLLSLCCATRNVCPQCDTIAQAYGLLCCPCDAV